MEQVKHTPGPWVSAHREQHDGMYSTQVFTEDGETVATVAWYPKDNGCGVTSTYREANARLIAAAPELLELLKEVLHEYEGGGYCASAALIEKAKASINKATGANQ